MSPRAGNGAGAFLSMWFSARYLSLIIAVSNQIKGSAMHVKNRRPIFRKYSPLFLLGAILLGLYGNVFADSKQADNFPLEKGNFWMYRGETKFLVPKKNASEEEKQKGIANEAKSEVLTWKMEVVDTLERPYVFAALIKGGPWDLAWYETNKPRGDYVILKWGNIYYDFSGEEALKIWLQLKKSKPSQPFPTMVQKELFERGEVLLKFPMQEGKTIEGKPEKDYEWVVASARALDPKRFPGAEKFPDATEYTLSYRARPEHMFLSFATGVGITSYSYAHHGTLAETDLELIEFGKAVTRGKDQTNAEEKKKPVKVEIIPDKGGMWGNVRITYEDGSSDFWTKKGNCTDAHIGPDGTVGWVVNEPIDRPQGPSAAFVQKLILCRRGRIIAKFESGNTQISQWDFRPQSNQVVMKTDTPHGPHGRFELFDIASGKCVKSVSEFDENLPDWVLTLEQH